MDLNRNEEGSRRASQVWEDQLSSSQSRPAPRVTTSEIFAGTSDFLSAQKRHADFLIPEHFQGLNTSVLFILVARSAPMNPVSPYLFTPIYQIHINRGVEKDEGVRRNYLNKAPEITAWLPRKQSKKADEELEAGKGSTNFPRHHSLLRLPSQRPGCGGSPCAPPVPPSRDALRERQRKRPPAGQLRPFFGRRGGEIMLFERPLPEMNPLRCC